MIESKIKKIWLLTLIIMIGGGLGGCMKENNKEEIVSYVEEKYNEKIVVEDYKPWDKWTEQYGGGEIIVHIENDEDLVFYAGMRDSKEGGYYDNYRSVKFALELKKDFEDVLRENIKAPYDYTVELSYMGAEENEGIVNEVVYEFLEDEKDKVSIVLDLCIQIENENDISKLFEGISNVYEILGEYNVSHYVLNIGFTKDIDNREIKEYLRKANAINSTWDDLGKDVYGKIAVDGSCNISTPDLLKNYYKSIRE